MEIKKIETILSVCQLQDISQVDFTDEYCFLSKTDEEISLVCAKDKVPANWTNRDDDWKAFRIQGILDFSLIGILSKLSALLAENHIGIFAVSTYNTDYILTKENDFDKAIQVLSKAGYHIL